MYAPKYFTTKYFAGRYFPPIGTGYPIFSAFAIIRAEHLGLLDAAAVVRKPTSSSTTAESIIRAENLAALVTGAILRNTNIASASIDALLKEASTPLTIDAVLLSPTPRQFGLDAWVSAGLPYDIDAVTSIPVIDATSSAVMLSFDGTALFLDHRDTSSMLVFDGGAEGYQNITLMPGVQAVAAVDDIDFESTQSIQDFESHIDALDVTDTTTGLIDFAGGVKEVTDG